jgi:hypothetical protein
MYIELCVESKDAFAFAACCATLAKLDPASPSLVAATHNARDPDCRVVCLTQASEPRTVPWPATRPDRLVTYVVDTLPGAVATDGKPEAFRRLRLRATDKADLVEFVYHALKAHRVDIANRAGGEGDGVPTYTWDDDAQCWTRGRARPRRPLATLFLPFGVAEDVHDDLVAFFDRAPELAELHVSPVRTYLLHGTPGSGKSSLVHCLASEMSYGIATLTFAPGMADADICAALARMPARCFLVVEDIDCAFAGRAAKNHGVAFGTILTALDGGMTDAPLAVFMTTNHLAELDPALRRRIDHVQEFKPATQAQARALFVAFFPSHDNDDDFQAVWAVARGSAMSVLQKYLVKARQSPGGGGVLTRLDMLQSLVDCCGGGGGAGNAMYG